MAQQQQPTFTEATPPQGGFIRATQAPELMARQKALNSAKRPAFIPNAIKRESQETQLYVFNVGPKRLEGNGSSYGTMMIHPCLAADATPPANYEGKPGEYSAPLVIPGMPHEYYNKEGNTLDVQFHGDGDIEDPGWDFACQVIGGYTDARGQWEGKFLSKSNSLEKFGVGISRTWPPQKADVELARRKMHAEYQILVQQAREAHAVGRLSSVVTDDHFIAARTLGLSAKTERWMEFSAAPEEKPTQQLCPKCRKGYEQGTVEHDCGFILDKKQYDQWVKDGLIAGVSLEK